MYQYIYTAYHVGVVWLWLDLNKLSRFINVWQLCNSHSLIYSFLELISTPHHSQAPAEVVGKDTRLVTGNYYANVMETAPNSTKVRLSEVRVSMGYENISISLATQIT